MQKFSHEEVAGKLTTVWTILSSQDIMKQQQAQPHRAQFGLYCPKVAVMLEGWATDALPARFEVAAQELSAKFQSGSQIGSAAQEPSAGSATLQVDLTHGHQCSLSQGCVLRTSLCALLVTNV